MSDTIMPYGVHKGKTMNDIPSDYLKWVAENFDDEDICCAADEEYQSREHYNAHWYE